MKKSEPEIGSFYIKVHVFSFFVLPICLLQILHVLASLHRILYNEHLAFTTCGSSANVSENVTSPTLRKMGVQISSKKSNLSFLEILTHPLTAIRVASASCAIEAVPFNMSYTCTYVLIRCIIVLYVYVSVSNTFNDCYVTCGR